MSCGKATDQRERAEQLQERERLTSLGFIPAGYAGVCSACGEWFPVGALIHANRPNGWRCCA